MMKPDVRHLERERVRRKLASDLFGAARTPVVIGRFEIKERLGQGSFGVAYAAFDPTLKRDVGIKVLSGDGDPEIALREARALAGLSHPNILQVFETGTHDGLPFIVVELVAGGNLRAWRAALSSAPLSREQTARVVDMLAQVSRGLAAAHERGLVHRDIKPENILVGSDDQPKIADFGLAAMIAAPDAVTAGTPRYAAPEQALGGLPDPRSDQYSFSVMGLELLGPACPANLRALLAKGASPNARDRHGSMAGLAALLQRSLAATARRRTILAVATASIVVISALALAIALGFARPAGRLASLATADSPSAGRPRSTPKSTALDVDRASQRAVRLLTAGDHRGCVDSLENDHGSAILSELRVNCARKLPTKEFRVVCAAHLARHKASADGCDEADFAARERSEMKDFGGCVRAIEVLAWSAQRSILIAECAQKLGTRDGYRRLCEFTKKAPNAPQAGNCGGA